MNAIDKLSSIFIGVMLAITVGFGIAAFYPPPIPPEYSSYAPSVTIPLESCYATPEAKETPQCQSYLKQQEENLSKNAVREKQYQEEIKQFKDKSADYNRTAIFLGVIAGSIFVILGLYLIKNSKVVAAGLLLGGVLTAVLTRFLVSLASLGAPVIGTGQANVIGFAEFGLLSVLSFIVVLFGLRTFRNEAKT